jgi:hypothetical protein
MRRATDFSGNLERDRPDKWDRFKTAKWLQVENRSQLFGGFDTPVGS